ncbi:MAG: hypothetical protein KF764_03405 [Labilithrix sp.]|nr:hypothetical protein [Labilithrix sp.]MBX3221087.1 hypothetical protein [Labilithrix sp.]
MRVRRSGVRLTVTLGLFALMFACGTRYGDGTEAEDSPGNGEDGGTARADAPPGVDGSTDDASRAVDATADAPPTFSEACPTCPNMSSCLASGCEGATTATCSKPFDLVDTSSPEQIVFVCPEGPTIDLPQMCVPGGKKDGLHVAVFRINAAASTSWKVTVTGSNAFVATGSCVQPTTCAGGTNGSTANVAGFTTVMVGTTSDINACQPITVRVEKR